MSEVKYTSLRKLNFETEKLVLNFSVAPTFLPCAITAEIRHNYDVPSSFGREMSNIASPEIQFTLVALPGIFSPTEKETVNPQKGVAKLPGWFDTVESSDLLEQGTVLVSTAWESAVPFIDFSKATKAPDCLDVWFDTNWDMVINSMVYALLLWRQDYNQRNRGLALDILGIIRDRLEDGWCDMQLAPRGSKGLARLIEASRIVGNHYHIGEYTVGDYSVWLKRKLTGTKNPTLESRWTFVKKHQISEIEVEDKTTYVITTPVNKKPAQLEDIVQLHELHHPITK